jgi:glycosyltransferase involved in cell wall biosynthesis
MRRVFYPLTRFFRPVLESLFPKRGEEFTDLIVGGFDDVDVINYHSPLADKYIYQAAYICKKKYGIPTVWMMNDLPGNLKAPKTNQQIKFIFDLIRGGPIGRYIDKGRITQIDQIVVLDKMNRDLVKRDIGLEAEIVRSGLDLEEFKFRKRRPNKRGFKILATGIFLPHRRFEDLIIALNILREKGYHMTLNLIASDVYSKPYAQKIVELVSVLNIKGQVNFLGAVSEEELVNNYSHSDVFVFPNHPQTWGLAVFEAMASGTPVIVSTGAGASEVLTDGENALLVSPRRPEEIAACLQKLFNDERLWERLSTNGRKFVEENIRWDLYGGKMLQLFQKIMRNRE